MDIKLKKSVSCMAAIVAVAIFNIITFSSNAGEIPLESTSQRGLPGGCYQTMGYCGGWDLNMKCTLDETAEFCHVYKCEKCTSN